MSTSLRQLQEIAPEISYAFNVMLEEFLQPDINFWPTMCKEEKINSYSTEEIFFDDYVPLFKTPQFQRPPQINILGGQQKLNLEKRAVGVRIPKITYEKFQAELEKKVRQIAVAASLIPRDDIVEILLLGDTSAYISYDGLPFFDTAHPKGGTTYSNLLNLPFNETNFQAMRTALMQIPADNDGTAMNIDGNRLIVPPVLYPSAAQLLQSETAVTLQQYAKNPFLAVAEPYTDGNITDPDDFYLVASGGASGVTPFVWLKHQKFSPVNLEFDASSYDEDMYCWKGETWEVVYPSHPYYAIKSIAP